MINIGGGVGTAASAMLAGLLIDNGVSWDSIFYIDGLLMLIPAAIYFQYGDNAPEGSELKIDKFRPWRFSNSIPTKELQLIVDGRETKKSEMKLAVPWMKIFFSKDVLLFSSAWFCATFVCKYLFVSRFRLNFRLVFAVQTLQPRFFQYLSFIDLGFATKLGTILSVFGIFIIIGCSIVVDKLCIVYDRQLIRKICFNLFSLISVILCGFVIAAPCNHYLVVIMVILTNFSVGLILTTATKTIPNEIGGEFAGQIYAYSNSISNISGVVCPSILGYLLDQVKFTRKA